MSTKVVKLTEGDIADAEIFIGSVLQEYIQARKKFGPFDNGHEAYAVILEELDEVWDEIKHPTYFSHLYNELVQVSAMCLAAAVELRSNYINGMA